MHRLFRTYPRSFFSRQLRLIALILAFSTHAWPASADYLLYTKLSDPEKFFVYKENDFTYAMSALLHRSDVKTIVVPHGVHRLTRCPHFNAAAGISLIGSIRRRPILQLEGQDCANPVFLWRGKDAFQISRLHIQMALISSRQLSSVFNLTGDTHLLVSGLTISGARAGGWLLLGIDGGSNGKIMHSRFIFDSCSDKQNQSINMSQSFGQLENWSISDVESVKSGIYLSGENVSIDRSKISGWCFGGGITVSIQSKFVSVLENIIYQSGKKHDENGTFPAGIEASGRNQKIVSNLIYDVADACILVRGKNSVVGANFCSRWGLGQSAARAQPNKAAFTFGFVNRNVNGDFFKTFSNVALSNQDCQSKLTFRLQQGVAHKPWADKGFTSIGCQDTKLYENFINP